MLLYLQHSNTNHYLVTVMLVIALIFIAFLITRNYFIRKNRQELKSTNHFFNQLPELINQLNETEDQKNILDIALETFINDFKFDYATISLLNFEHNSIKINYSKTVNPDLIDPTNWHDFVNFDIKESKDVQVQVIRYNTIFEAVGPIIDGKNILETQPGFFNDTIYNQYNHKDLTRLFLPLSFNPGATNLKSNIWGVIEVGYHQSKNPPSTFSQAIKTSLKIYIGHLAEHYQAYFIKDYTQKKVASIVEKHLKEDSHQLYLKKVLKELCQLYEVDFGLICFSSFNYPQINILEAPIFYGFSEEDIIAESRQKIKSDKPINDIIQYVEKTEKAYLANEVERDDKYLPLLEGIQSMIAIPMIYSNGLVGVMSFFSKKPKHFNRPQVEVIESLTNRAIIEYRKKKIYNATQKLIFPSNVFANFDDIFTPIVNVIEEYFNTQYVAVWLRKTKQNKTFILSSASSKQIYPLYESLDFKKVDIKINRLSKDEPYIQIRSIKDIENKKSRIYQLMKENQFPNYILVNIPIDDTYYAFINIFSTHPLSKVFPNDRAFLTQIRTKTSMVIQTATFIHSFKQISTSLSDENNLANIKDTLQIIANNALNVLNADIVSLFIAPTNNTPIIMGDGVTVGEYKYNPPRYNREINHAKLILEEGTKWINNKTEFEEVFSKVYQQPIKEEFTFWQKEKLTKVAALRLENKGKPLGVMFVNFRYKVKGTEKIEENLFIKTFADLATTAIVNAQYVAEINHQKIELEKKKAELQVKYDRILFEYESVYKKMEDMLPKVTYSSYYFLVKGVSHDLRNFLLRTKLIIENINISHLYKKDRNLIENQLNSVEKLLIIINRNLNLFDFAYLESEIFRINEVIKSIISFITLKMEDQTKELINIDTTKLNPNIPDIQAVKAEFSMIIYNLLINAVTAIEQKQEIKATFQGEIKIITETRDTDYYIQIWDNGIGISNENLATVFKAGFTTKKEGLGIGLYFVKEILIQKFNNATITVNSSFGNWTKFEIFIPLDINWLK